jgi:hypothetical protein
MNGHQGSSNEERRVLYRWSDVLEWLDHNIFQRTDDPREQR